MYTFLKLSAVSLTFVAILSVGFFKNEKMMEQRNQQYSCDAYAYDQQSAPSYCK